MNESATLPDSPDRAELERILHSLVPPANFRVVMNVERDTEKLSIRVLRADPWVLKLFGRTLWCAEPDWSAEKAVQRAITARTYAGLLTQLHANPEFLEFELVIEGATSYRHAVPQTT